MKKLGRKLHLENAYYVIPSEKEKLLRLLSEQYDELVQSRLRLRGWT